MTKLLSSALAAALISGAFAAPAIAADVGVSINIGEPGFYGRLDIGDFPQPAVIYSEPVIIERGPGYGSRAPIYLRVPPGYEQHWRRYCRQYDACGQPVFFVRDRWYQDTYAPHYREHHGGSRHGGEHDNGHHGNGHHDGDRRDDDRGEHHGDDHD